LIRRAASENKGDCIQFINLQSVADEKHLNAFYKMCSKTNKNDRVKHNSVIFIFTSKLIFFFLPVHFRHPFS